LDGLELLQLFRTADGDYDDYDDDEVEWSHPVVEEGTLGTSSDPVNPLQPLYARPSKEERVEKLHLDSLELLQLLRIKADGGDDKDNDEAEWSHLVVEETRLSTHAPCLRRAAQAALSSGRTLENVKAWERGTATPGRSRAEASAGVEFCNGNLCDGASYTDDVTIKLKLGGRLRTDDWEERRKHSWRRQTSIAGQKLCGGKEERFTCAHMKPFEEEASVIVGAI